MGAREFRVAPEGYVPPGDLTDEEWRAHDRAFRLLHRALHDNVGSAVMRMGRVTPHIDWSVHARASIDHGLVRHYVAALKSGCRLPPIVTLPDGRIIDGLHRHAALCAVGREPQVIVVPPLDDLTALAVSTMVNSSIRPTALGQDAGQVIRDHLAANPGTDLEELAHDLGVDIEFVRECAREVELSRHDREDEDPPPEPPPHENP